MFSRINIGVLGCANIAERFMIPAINELDGFNLIGVASRDNFKANEFAHRFQTKAYDSYEELLSSPDIQAVYIPLPNSLHYTWVKKALKNNIHVLVEKSMACSYGEVLELNNLAEKKGLVLVENFQFRFHSQLAYIKDIIKDGKIGELRNVRSSFGFPPFYDQDNIRYKKHLGGGALLDAGAYPIKITQFFLGEDVFVDSASLEIPDNQEVDIWGSAFIKQKKGKLTSQIAFGFDNFYQNFIELWGSSGKITANRIFTAAPDFEPTIVVESNDCIETIKLPSDHHFKNMLTHFNHLIVTKKGLRLEYKQNITQARLVNELNEKAR